jgi:hypothetical protein
MKLNIFEAVKYGSDADHLRTEWGETPAIGDIVRMDDLDFEIAAIFTYKGMELSEDLQVNLIEFKPVGSALPPFEKWSCNTARYEYPDLGFTRFDLVIEVSGINNEKQLGISVMYDAEDFPQIGDRTIAGYTPIDDHPTKVKSIEGDWVIDRITSYAPSSATEYPHHPYDRVHIGWCKFDPLPTLTPELILA